MAAGMTPPNELHDPVAIALDIGARLDQLRVEWLIGGWRDVFRAIVRIQGDRLDRDRLRLWADRLGVMDLLQRILTETAR